MSTHSPFDHEALPDLQSIPSLKRRARGVSKLDALAWSAGLSFLAYGVRIGIRSNRAQALQDSLEGLPVGWKPSSSPVVDRLYSVICEEADGQEAITGYQLYKDNRLLLRCADRNDLLDRLEADIALHVADATPKRVFVHAGVVGWKGRAILVPGRSFAGKTTLIAALVRAGATYYSDEFAVIDARGMVHPYPRPLQVRMDGDSRQTRRSVEELGGVAGHVPLPVGLVMLSRYKPGAKWHPRPISQGQALLGILDNTVSARRAPTVAMKTLKEVVSSSLMVKGIRGEAQEVVDWIATHFHPQMLFPRQDG